MMGELEDSWAAYGYPTQAIEILSELSFLLSFWNKFV